MPHDPQAEDARLHPAAAPGLHGPAPGPSGHGPDPGALGQAIADRLFSAGMDLQFALMVAGDGPAASHLRHAVDQLDEAVKDLRHLVLAVQGHTAETSPDDGGGSAQQ